MKLNKQQKIVGGALAVAGLGYLALRHIRGPFHPLVKNQTLRGCDAHGCGHFGALRDNGSRSHNGLDIKVQVGEGVYSPINGKVVRYAYPYSDDKTIMGLALQNLNYFIKIYYFKPEVKPGDFVVAGQRIGKADDIGRRYPGIVPHLHFEAWDRTKTNVAVDPTRLF